MKIIKIIKKCAKTIFLGPLLPILAVGDNVDGEVKFANTIVEVDGEVVAKVTSFNNNISVSEENITGSEDVVAGSDVLHEKFTSIAVSQTASVEGITIETEQAGKDDGQSELNDAVESGKIVTLRCVKSNGFGWLLNGFFTSYEESGDTTKVFKYKATFRINSKTSITPGS